MPAELHQIGMRHNAVVYVHREFVGRIAASPLCNENQIPGAVVRGSGFGSRRQGKAGTANDIRDQSLVHDLLSRGIG
jgi:hypothetical protein